MERYDTVSSLGAAFGLHQTQTAALDRYVDAVLAWPGNVTAARCREAIVSTLVGDALALLDVPQLLSVPGVWLDLGAGAGVPGIPLAVACLAVEITLLDSASRKCAFLGQAVKAAGLEDRGRVVCARSEEYAAEGRPGREAYHVVLARAVASLPALVELAAPLLTTGGVLLACKTAEAVGEEGAAAERAAARCGLARKPQCLSLALRWTAVCAVYEKTGPTPARLPRRPGMAVKRPFAR
jgi:16S rRNA (guanine527-N7)-methyltransferase